MQKYLNKVINMDCIELMKKLPDKSIDMILCDLPYGTTACKWDTIIPFDKLWECYKRIIKDNAAIVLTASQPFTSLLVCSNLEMFKYELIWNKSRALGFAHAKNAPLKKHENILLFSNGYIKHNRQKNRMIYFPQGLKNYGKIVNGDKSCKADIKGHKFARKSNKIYKQEFTNYPNSVLNFNNDGKTFHPTQKPIALGQYLIKTYSNKNDIVLDNCCGSGSFLISAIIEDRKFIGCYTSREYCDIANARIKAEQSQGKLYL